MRDTSRERILEDVDRFIRPDRNLYASFSGGALIDAAGGLVGRALTDRRNIVPISLRVRTAVAASRE